VKLLVLSNVNVAPIAGRLEGHDVSLGEYGDVVRVLADPGSAAYAGDLDALVVLVDGDELLSAGDLADELVEAVGAYAAARSDTLVIASTVCGDPATPLSYGAPLTPESAWSRGMEANAALRLLAGAHPNVALLDVNLVFDRHGRDRLVSPTFWYAGRIPYTTLWFEECARHLGGLLEAYQSRARKVLVLDLDGTLWGGVIGEDGPGGIELGEDGVGKCYRDLQRRIQDLRGTGVLLAVASKNEPADVDKVLAEHPMMLIRSADLATQRVDWNDKVTSLASIAEELSLGLDSFVFLDDNPVERALVAEHLPEVAVPDFPTRPELLSTWFVQEVVYPYFPKLRVLDSDRAKTEQYRARGERSRAIGSSVDLDAFLERLDMQIDLRVDDGFLVDRAAQMTQKTNQFNLTLQRFTPGEVQEMVEGTRHVVITLGYSDRFGDEGIVGLAILDTETAEIVVFLLSCRVIGRGVEDRLLERVELEAAERGLRAIHCTFVPAPRNRVASEYLGRRGWTEVETRPGGEVHYRRDLR
jgi:FkbH-like protein